MPVPRYRPVLKKKPTVSPSLDNLDDTTLSKIIGYALSLSALNDKDDYTLCDNEKTERNLSMVSKRWYFLTQSQIKSHGVHKINLDKVRADLYKPIKPSRTSSLRKPEGALGHRGFGAIRRLDMQQMTEPSNPYDLRLFRYIGPKLYRYKYIIIEGSLSSEDYLKLLVALNSAQVEFLSVRMEITKANCRLTCLPNQMPYLKKLTLHWSHSLINSLSNGYIWAIFDRAINLRELEIFLTDETASDTRENQSNGKDSIERICARFIESNSSSYQNLNTHEKLESIVFTRSSTKPPLDCRYTSLLRNLLTREISVNHVDTNDGALIEYIIKSFDRKSMARELRSLGFQTPISDLDLLAQLLRSKSLATDSLSIIIDTIDNIEEVRLNMEHFKLNRHELSSSQISLYIKDQKFPDCEKKIQILVSLIKLADMIVYVDAQQRISIDCCHLMWSVGRALQAHDLTGGCLFKITLQLPLNKNGSNVTEVTVPIGTCSKYKINQKREDVSRHQEILRALKKGCYNLFVKSVREFRSNS